LKNATLLHHSQDQEQGEPQAGTVLLQWDEDHPEWLGEAEVLLDDLWSILQKPVCLFCVSCCVRAACWIC
jgi:hypothetical protein